MSRLTELKEKYAVQQGFDSWKELWFDTTNYKQANQRIDELSKLYAKECSQASLEKASFMAECCALDYNDFEVNKESITNKDNIILL